VLVDDFFQPYALQIKGAPEFLAARTAETDQLKTNSAARQGRWSEPTRIAGLSIPSRYRLEVELDKPDTSFKAWFPQNLGMALARESLPDLQEAISQHVVGTGPYVLKEWIRGVRIRLERNPYYFRPEQQYFDAVEIFIGGDETTHLMMFERGELDLAGLERTGVPEADFSRLRKDPRWRTNWLEGPIFNIAAIILNTEVPPLNDVRVRQAIAHAIRRDHFQQKLNHDRMDPGAGVITPTMPGFNPALNYHNYDTNRARALLREAGFPEGISQPITFWHIDDQIYRRWAQAIGADLKEVGIPTVLKGVTAAAFSTSRGQRGKIPMQIYAESALFPDASGFLCTFHGRQIKASGSMNVAFYDNPKINTLLDEAVAGAQEAHRLELYRQAEQIFVDDAPVVVLGHPKIFALRQPWLQGPLLDPYWWYRFDRVWIEK
jgi:peptide/nickel transport system substrate-binding protein